MLHADSDVQGTFCAPAWNQWSVQQDFQHVVANETHVVFGAPQLPIKEEQKLFFWMTSPWCFQPTLTPFLAML